VIIEIGHKTDIINEIVFQTKLLSFNASVEAARAGEHGAGFAVVAEEVGKLAQMSGNAAKEIGTLLRESTEKVESIVFKTKTAVETLLSDSKSKADFGMNVANQCSDVFEKIVKDVSHVSQRAREIVNACNEQSKGITEVTDAIVQFDSTTQQNVITSEQFSRWAKSLKAQAVSLESVTSSLTDTISIELSYRTSSPNSGGSARIGHFSTETHHPDHNDIVADANISSNNDSLIFGASIEKEKESPNKNSAVDDKRFGKFG